MKYIYAYAISQIGKSVLFTFLNQIFVLFPLSVAEGEKKDSLNETSLCFALIVLR